MNTDAILRRAEHEPTLALSRWRERITDEASITIQQQIPRDRLKV